MWPLLALLVRSLPGRVPYASASRTLAQPRILQLPLLHITRSFNSAVSASSSRIQRGEEEDEEERELAFSPSQVASSPPLSTTSATAAVSPFVSLPTHALGFPISETSLPCPAPSFLQLKLASHLCNRLQSLGYTAPTLIQSAVLPHLTRKPSSLPPPSAYPDLLVWDAPGQGKSLCYLLPQCSQLSPYLHALQSLVIVPSRELALQLARTVQELSEGGKKARMRNPLRVDLAVGAVNPSMCHSLTTPRPVRPLTEAERRNAAIPTREWQAEWEADEGGGGRCAVPQMLIGTADVVWELLVKRRLLDTSHLTFITVDEADVLIANRNSAHQLADLVQLRNRLDVPWTQVTLVSSLLTPAMLRFAGRHLSRHRHLLTAASVPGECARRHRLLMTESAEGKDGRTLRLQRLQLNPHVSHHFARMPAAVSVKEKAEMLLQLCLAIRASFLASHPRIGQPQWIRHESSQLRMGLASVPPLSSHPPQTTLVVFRSPADMLPLLSLLSSHLRIGLLSSLSSRTERREALSLHPAPQLLLAEATLLRGLDLKTVSHVVNWDVVSEREYFLRSGRCGRKGQVHRYGRVITLVRDGEGEEEERLHRIVRSLGGRGVTQVVVRGDRMYERGKRRLRAETPPPPTPNAQQLPALRFLDHLLYPSQASINKNLPSQNSLARVPGHRRECDY